MLKLKLMYVNAYTYVVACEIKIASTYCFYLQAYAD